MQRDFDQLFQEIQANKYEIKPRDCFDSAP